MKAKNILLNVLAVGFGVFVCLMGLEIVARFLPVSGGFLYSAVNDSHPIQTYEPDRDYTFERGSRFDIVNRGRINNYGFVNNLDYDPKATSPLLAVVGDSYIEALMVPYQDTLQGRLASSLQGRARVYSFAISGSQLSQYLMFAEHARDLFHPQGLVVTVIANDFDESLKEYKKSPGPGLHYYQENAAGALALHRVDYQPDRFRRLIAKSALVRYLRHSMSMIKLPWTPKNSWQREEKFVANTASEFDTRRMSLSKKVVDQFLVDFPVRSGLSPENIVLVLDGIRPALYDSRSLEDVRESYIAIIGKYLVDQAAARGFEVIDMQPRFIARHKQDGARFEFPTDSHWNGEGHREAAKAVQESKMFARLFN